MIFRSSPRFASPPRAAWIALAGGAAAIFATNANAQMSAGLLGARHVETTVFMEDIRQSGVSSGYGLAMRAHLPVSESFVVSFGGLAERLSTNRYREQQASAALTWHGETSGFHPFAELALTNVWQSSTVGAQRFSRDEALYGIGVGVEAPVSDATAVAAKVSYQKYFTDSLGDYLLTTVGINHWLSGNVAVLASVTFRDSDSVYYNAGLGVRF